MQQTMVNLHAQAQVLLPPRDRLGYFQCTKPPTFSHVVELMDADDWLSLLRRSCKWCSATTVRSCY
jgi:hypothetical protein